MTSVTPCTFLLIEFYSYSFEFSAKQQNISFSQETDLSHALIILKTVSNSIEDWHIQQMLAETTSSIHGGIVVIQKLLSNLLNILQTNKSEASRITSNHVPLSKVFVAQTPNRHVNTACAYIQKHIYEKISLNDVARHMAFTPSYLSGLFKKYTGMTISAYIVDQKLQYAAELLTSTNKSIKTIALDLKFCDSQHFSKSFLKKYGKRPLAYRQYRKQMQPQNHHE